MRSREYEMNEINEDRYTQLDRSEKHRKKHRKKYNREKNSKNKKSKFASASNKKKHLKSLDMFRVVKICGWRRG